MPATDARHRFFIWTIGCQMNKADGERMSRDLMSAGHRPALSLADATAVVVNGCAVRENADRKVWGMLGLLQGAKRRRPELLVGLTGCTVHADRTELEPHLRPVDVLFDSLNVEPMLARMTRQIPGTDAYEDVEAAPLPGVGSVSRYVNIIYGCDKRCTYCIVPFRRGAQRSRPLERDRRRRPGNSSTKARERLSSSARSSTPTGSISMAIALPDALAAVDAIPGVERVRFVTAHPQFMTEPLALAMRDLPSVCEEINLPVQAGDDTVLRRMARGYSVAHYREMIAMLRVDRAAGRRDHGRHRGLLRETAEQFEHSRELVVDLKFDQVHVAAFSPRQGTTAGDWADDVPQDEKLRRLHEIERVQTPIARKINAALVGSVEDVLLESLERGKSQGRPPTWRGRTRANKLVFCPDHPGIHAGDTVPMQVTAATPWSLRGAVQPVAVPA